MIQPQLTDWLYKDDPRAHAAVMLPLGQCLQWELHQPCLTMSDKELFAFPLLLKEC